jgi:hypothetical protein
MQGIINKGKEAVNKFKSDDGKTGVSGLTSEAKESYGEYKQDAADGKVDWKKQGQDAFDTYGKGFGGGAKPATTAAATNQAHGDPLVPGAPAAAPPTTGVIPK